MKRHIGSRFGAVCSALSGLCLVTPGHASAEYLAAAIMAPLYTPSCPSYVTGFEAAGITAATGVDELYISTITLQINLSGPDYTVTTNPPVLSEPVSGTLNAVDWYYTRNPAEHGAHLLTTTHQWILALVGTAITDYKSAFVFVDRP